MSELTELESTVEKGGETLLITNISRGLRGIFITLKAHPLLEEFTANLGTGELLDVRAQYGRSWNSRDDSPLQVYDLTEPSLQGVLRAGNTSYRIDRPGAALIEEVQERDPDRDRPTYRTVINASFLRLQGIGTGGGVCLHIKGPFPSSQVRTLQTAWDDILVHLYRTFMQKMDITIITTSSKVLG